MLYVSQLWREIQLWCANNTNDTATHTQLYSTWDPRIEANNDLWESDCALSDYYDSWFNYDTGGPHNISLILLILPVGYTDLNYIDIHVSYEHFILFKFVDLSIACQILQP